MAGAGDTLRSLIDRIVLTPGDGVLHAELHGDLATIAGFAQTQERKNNSAGSGGDPALLSVVAGERNQRYLQPLRSRVPVISCAVPTAAGAPSP